MNAEIGVIIVLGPIPKGANPAGKVHVIDDVVPALDECIKDPFGICRCACFDSGFGFGEVIFVFRVKFLPDKACLRLDNLDEDERCDGSKDYDRFHSSLIYGEVFGTGQQVSVFLFALYIVCTDGLQHSVAAFARAECRVDELVAAAKASADGLDITGLADTRPSFE